MANYQLQRINISGASGFRPSVAQGRVPYLTYRKRVSLPPSMRTWLSRPYPLSKVGFNLEYGDNLSMVAEAHENGMGYGTLKGFTEVVENILYENESKAKASASSPFKEATTQAVLQEGVETTLEQLLAEGYPKSSLVRSGQAPAVLMLYANNIVAVN